MARSVKAAEKCNVANSWTTTDKPRDDYRIAYGHEALQRTITFKSDEGEVLAKINGQIGVALPSLPDRCRHPVPGLVMEGAYLGDTSGKKWYGRNGDPELNAYEGTDDVTLVVKYAIDSASIADVPESRQFDYDGSNHVGFVARQYPGCEFIGGVTNAVVPGVYSFRVGLADGFEAWSDFLTYDVRTIQWEIDRAAITNEWNGNLTYDWTKSPAENEEYLQSHGLGFDLPKGATVTFTKGRRVQTNVEELQAHIEGGTYYLDRDMYGSYSCAQPFRLSLRSYYPWETKVGISYAEASFVISNAVREAFMEKYGASNVVASAKLTHADGSVEYVELDSRFTVWDVSESGFNSMKYSVVDLREKLGNKLDDVGGRCFALPITLSIGGQMFDGGSVSVDLTPEPDQTDGWLRYEVNDIRDIYSILASVVLVDAGHAIEVSSDPNLYHPIMAIGTPESPGERFWPQTKTEPIVTDSITWQPTSAGEYMLEHWVTNHHAGITGYRRAYFNICGKGGEQPYLGRPDTVVVEVTRTATGEKIGYKSLKDALAEIHYGDTITVKGDVQMELETIPSGTLLVVDRSGVVRDPSAYIRYDYDKLGAPLQPQGNEKLRIAYLLDEDKVRTTFVAADAMTANALPFGLFDGRFNFTIDNVKPDLYYLVKRSDDLRSWTVVDKVAANGKSGKMSVSAPAEGDVGFYGVKATDDPSPKYTTTPNSDGSVSVTGVDVEALSGTLAIPSEIGGKTVTAISANAFASRSGVTAVDIPATVERIGSSAFGGCTGLASLYVPESVETLGAQAFAGCSGVVALTLCEGLETIEDGALDGLAITDLVIPASVTSLGSLNLPNLRTLRFLGKPAAVSKTMKLAEGCQIYAASNAGWTGVPGTLNGYALDYWAGFTYAVEDGKAVITGCETIPEDGTLRLPAVIDGYLVTAIGDLAFKDRKDGFAVLIVPEGVTAIGNLAFDGCSDLRTVELPASLESLGGFTFGTGKNPSGVTSITFKGEPPEVDGEVNLDPAKCTVHASDGFGWGETWQRGPVECEWVCWYWDPVPQSRHVVADYVEVTSGTATLENGKWYVVKGSNVSRGTISVNGAANLILADGAKLTVTGTDSGHHAALEVPSSSTLAIYGQGEGTGKLVANGAYCGAGIGGAEGQACGAVRICGGTIEAKGNQSSAGIGGGNMAAFGTVEIYGGTVTATAGAQTNTEKLPPTDIGPGQEQPVGGAVTITGGSVLRTNGTGTEPKNADNAAVYCVTVPGLTANAAVTLGGDLSGYGAKDVFADANGKVYLYLPNGAYSFTANGKSYTATVKDGPATAE